MNRKSKNKLYLVAAAVTIIIIIVGSTIYQHRAGDLDGLASCLEANGARMYGAFWCSACNAQKEMFGQSARLLPYVECSTADGQTMTFACQGKNISAYPTWEFADGTTQVGVMSLGDLAAETGCQEVL
ncbi:MAG: hypothetical protein RB292_00930 [Patescibacteria group bacterium]|jgi:hypothetical protein|nr:hypothetical protein [Patescibacteria group bacterium]